MSDLSKPLAVQIEEWRQKAISHQFTPEEYRAIIETLRNGRATAGKTAVAKRSSKEPVNVGGLIDEIDSI